MAPKGNLLIVEDDSLLAESLKLNLSDCADQIFLAEDGLAGLEVMAQQNIHCIVCDINMPRMNGVEFLIKLRSQNKMLPFIFFTGHGNRELMLEAVKYGVFDFIDKPHFRGLEEVVNRGLKLALTGIETPPDETVLITEYQKLLNTLA